MMAEGGRWGGSERLPKTGGDIWTEAWPMAEGIHMKAWGENLPDKV